MTVSPFIAKLQHFCGLSQEELAILTFEDAPRKTLGPNKDLIREGTRSASVMIVECGWAISYKNLEDGRRQILSFVLPGDVCESNVLVMQKMDYSIAALSQLSITEISLKRLRSLLQSHPRIADAFGWESFVSSSIQRERSLSLGRRSAIERVAHLICELFVRMRAVGQTSGDTFSFPVTQAELGDATGLSAVHVNRTLKELRDAGLVSLRAGSVQLLDREAMMRLSMFDASYLHLETSRDGHWPEPGSRDIAR